MCLLMLIYIMISAIMYTGPIPYSYSTDVHVVLQIYLSVLVVDYNLPFCSSGTSVFTSVVHMYVPRLKIMLYLRNSQLLKLRHFRV